MGYAGDIVGRSRAFTTTLVFTVIGALLSAVAPWGSTSLTYAILIVCRFVIGFGVGGVYPLSATKAAEAGSSRVEAATRSAGAFFWQSPGYMGPYIVAIILRASLRSQDESLQWRLLLGLGAVPALLVLLLSTTPPKSTVTKSPNLGSALKTTSWRHLVGTGGGWLLYDVAFYGFSLMGPTVVASCFKSSESLMDDAWQQLLAMSFSIPAVIATLYFIKVGVEPKTLQLIGFYLMAVVYGIFIGLRSAGIYGWRLFAAYCLINFGLNFGPNVTTFVLPAATFPKKTRATLNGVSSALGKVGAVLGTEILPILDEKLGMNAVLAACAAVSLLGALVTHTCVDNVFAIVEEKDDDDDDDKPDPLLPTSDLSGAVL